MPLEEPTVPPCHIAHQHTATLLCSRAGFASANVSVLPSCKEESSVRLSTKGRLGRITYKMPVTPERAARKGTLLQFALKATSKPSAVRRDLVQDICCLTVQRCAKHHGASWESPKLRATSTCDSTVSCTFPGTRKFKANTMSMRLRPPAPPASLHSGHPHMGEGKSTPASPNVPHHCGRTCSRSSCSRCLRLRWVLEMP